LKLSVKGFFYVIVTLKHRSVIICTNQKLHLYITHSKRERGSRIGCTSYLISRHSRAYSLIRVLGLHIHLKINFRILLLRLFNTFRDIGRSYSCVIPISTHCSGIRLGLPGVVFHTYILFENHHSRNVHCTLFVNIKFNNQVLFFNSYYIYIL